MLARLDGGFGFVMLMRVVRAKPALQWARSAAFHTYNRAFRSSETLCAFAQSVSRPDRCWRKMSSSWEVASLAWQPATFWRSAVLLPL